MTNLEKELVQRGFKRLSWKVGEIYYVNDEADTVLFEHGKLIRPLPRISSNGTIIKHYETILEVIRKYDEDSVVDAMFNKKITLTI
jgi:hypothetical protein